ncbi:sensor histidine kinase, partial [Cetobacterium sp.]|uniref:sensor histidine kinase n=1 Tax=Cetobacterium sp. TaxID=2071632 RepID=UPI003F2BC094
PITVISGYTYYIKDILQKEDQKYCDLIINECIGISQLAKKFQLLAENFKNLEISSFYLDELVKSIIDKFQLDFSEKNISIEFHSKPIEIIGDYNLIKVAIDNLISNSLKFAKDTISISIYSNDNDIVFSIYNNGANIPPDKISKIWEPFFFIEKNSKVDNWGFGLSIVADIVKRHNGNYKVENKDIGVEFRIILPKISK